MSPKVKDLVKENLTSFRNSIKSGFSKDHNDFFIPWMTYPAIEFIKKNINKNSLIFEFGCGSSTIFFAANCRQVISLETNKIWQAIINQKLVENNLKNSQIYLNENGINDDNYQNFILDYVKQNQVKFDVVVIDSIKRFQCSLASIDVIHEKSIIILDDSERKHYQKIFDFFEQKNFTRMDFFGVAPAQLRMKNTSIFIKNNRISE